ncbi:hypothetical protein RIF29_28343 [Crotalaria pallida]|uniref:Uncharacterized protein n=1 Tax=Crotalaria pallida TaxID=3830 RepID=A0AAN9I3A7_CROPI
MMSPPQHITSHLHQTLPQPQLSHQIPTHSSFLKLKLHTNNFNYIHNIIIFNVSLTPSIPPSTHILPLIR